MIRSDYKRARREHPDRPDLWVPDKSTLRLYSRFIMKVQRYFSNQGNGDVSKELADVLTKTLRELDDPWVMAGYLEDLVRSGLLEENVQGVSLQVAELCDQSAGFEKSRDRFEIALGNLAQERENLKLPEKVMSFVQSLRNREVLESASEILSGLFSAYGQAACTSAPA